MNLQTPINRSNMARLSLLVLGVGGSLLSFVGMIVGGLAGMTFGGNYPVLFDYGGLPGYEGASWFGAMLGAAACSLALIGFWTRDSDATKKLLAAYSAFWFISAVWQHFVILLSASRDGSILPAITPIVLTSVAAYFMIGKNNGAPDENS